METPIEKILFLIQEDDDDQSERLQSLYEGAGAEEKKLIDDVLICLCGYSLKTILDGNG